MQFNRKKGNETKTMRNSLTTEKKLVFVSLFLMNLITCTCCWYILCYFECALHSQVTTTPYSWLNFFFLFSHRKKNDRIDECCETIPLRLHFNLFVCFCSTSEYWHVHNVDAWISGAHWYFSFHCTFDIYTKTV